MASSKTAAKPRRPRAGRLASRIHDTLESAIKVFKHQKTPYALIGGLAVGLRSAPRTTQDIDFAVDVDDPTAEKLVNAFAARGFRVDAVLVNAVDRSLATVRVTEPNTSISIDLLFSLCGIEREVVRASTVERWQDLKIHASTSGHLIAMKTLSNRNLDRSDVENLLRDSSAVERKRALKAVAHIMAMGRAPGRDLVVELERAFELPTLADARFEQTTWPRAAKLK